MPPDETALKQRKHNHKCCILDCHNNSLNSPHLQFYYFPKASVFFPAVSAQRKAWIDAINMKNSDGSNWVPNRYTRICSGHFVGNEKSIDPLNPSYKPSIFPGDSKEKNLNALAALKRYKKKQMRDVRAKEEKERQECKNQIKNKEQMTQVDFLETGNEQDIFICNRFIGLSICHAETQACIAL